MPNMNPKKNEMPTQAPEVRAHNFSEVALGYEESVAVDEANRCLNCKTMPCVSGCPVTCSLNGRGKDIKATLLTSEVPPLGRTEM